MTGRFQTHGGKLVRATPATGASGCLIRSSIDGAWYFRVYTSNDNSTFDDYELIHLDLAITVDDECAAFYADGDGNLWLDYDPQTYGYSGQ